MIEDISIWTRVPYSGVGCRKNGAQSSREMNLITGLKSELGLFFRAFLNLAPQDFFHRSLFLVLNAWVRFVEIFIYY